MALSTEWVALKTGQSGSGGVEYSNSGMNGHLDKPINVDKLYQTIAQVISKE